MSLRIDGREETALRSIKITPHYLKEAEGSVLIEMGATQVLCTASVEEKVPPFLKGKSSGWVTAEYGMLPRATLVRTRREATAGKQTGRSQEIQRLIGRSLRQAVSLGDMEGVQIILDCDVLQADGGTRTASITGAYVALHLAVLHALQQNILKKNPLIEPVAAVSVGMVSGRALLDLNYIEDSSCDSDINVVMNKAGKIIEIKGTAEKTGFTSNELNQLLLYAKKGIEELFVAQQKAIDCAKVSL